MTGSRLRRAVVFAPDQAQPDGGAFFGDLRSGVESLGFQVHFIDTALACEDGYEGVDRIVGYWWSRERELLQSADLLSGNALGGVIAHGVARLLPSTVPLVTISAPTRSDARLDERLLEIIQLCDAGQLLDALRLLDKRVGSPTVRNHLPNDLDHSRALLRVREGLSAITNYSCLGNGCAASRRHLAFVGELSALTTRNNIAGCGSLHIEEIPGAGMRPHIEQPTNVMKRLVQFLHSKEEVPA